MLDGKRDSERTREELLQEIAELRARLEEPEETVGAIRRGEVDAFVVHEAGGEQIYTLGTAELLHELRVVTDSLPVLVSYVGRDLRYRFVNRAYESWFGRPVHQISGHTVGDVLGPAAWAQLRERIESVFGGRPVRFEHWLELAGAGRRCANVTLIPHVHEGEVRGYVSFIQDVSERRRAEESLRLLADAGRLLEAAPGGETLLEEAVRLAVPGLADWSAIELRQADGAPAPGAGVAQAGGAAPAAAACTSRLEVQLETRGRTLGTWSFVHAGSGRRHSQEDAQVARELAGRVAAALDNSRLYRDLEAANRAKDQFLAALSHELRTPLAPVLATASRLALHPALPADVGAGLAVIHRNVELEARLIDDLLDLTRISRGRLEVHSAPTDLREVIRQALDTCDEQARAARHVTLDLAAAEHLVWGDPVRLVQVFWNLLSNALKFTPPGGEIRVRSRGEAPPAAPWEPAQRPRALVVEIADSGVGVEPEALGRIFGAFEQGGAATGRLYGGLGLGLAICRAIVELHGGSLTAASPGRDAGATFTVRLPLAAAVDTGAQLKTPATPGPEPAADRAAAPLHILLVEDHADSATALADLLEVIGHRVTVTNSVAATLAAVESGAAGPIDLVISDLGLPDGDGHQLMRILGARHGLRGIALSGYGMESDLARSRDAGFDLHLIKPVTLETLRDAIQRFAAPAAGQAAG